MTADAVYSQNEEYFRDYDETAEALHHNEQLIQQQREERKMAWEPKNNKIGIFKNKFKNKEKDPTLTGRGLVGGIEYKVAGWKNIDKNGDPYISLSFTIPQDSGQRYAPAPAPTTDEDFPF